MFIAWRFIGSLRLSTAAIALACGGTLFAQQPAPAPAATSSAGLSALPLNGLDLTKTMPFDFQDATVGAILASMSEHLGFVVISTTLPDKRLSLHMKKELGAEEAVRTINAILSPMGYVALVSNTNPPTGKGGSTILRIVTIADGGKSQLPVVRGSDPLQIPVSDELRTQIIPVDTLTAVGLLNELRPLVGSGADVTADAVSNSIVITDTAAKIHRLVEIIHTLDTTPKPRPAYQLKQLQNAKAADAAQLINAIFSPPTGTGPAGAGTATVISGGNTNAMNAGRGGGGGTSVEGRFYAGADARTNIVILTGPDDQVVEALDLLARMDSLPSDELNTAIILLKRLNAADAGQTADTLNQIFGNSAATGAAGTSTSRGLTKSGGSGSGLGTTGGANRGSTGGAAARGGVGRIGN